MKKTIEERLSIIEARNQKVESDKAWETSWTRRLSIMLLTYVVVVIYLHFVVHIEPWVNGLVPVIGFVLSTLTVSLLKSEWLRRRNTASK
jgi:hypothetical protein